MEFYHHKTEDYYKKFIELQTKLRKSEEERFMLEMKFNKLVHESKEEKREHYRKMSNKYKSFLNDDKKRQERNEKLLQSLENIESRINMLMAKTERFNLLRKQYNFFLKQAPSRSGTNMNERRENSFIRENKDRLFTYDYGDKAEKNAVNDVFHQKILRNRDREAQRNNYMEDSAPTKNFTDYARYDYTNYPKSNDVISNGELSSGNNYLPGMYAYDKGMNDEPNKSANRGTNNEQHDALHRKSIDEMRQNLNETKLSSAKLQETENEQFMVNNGFNDKNSVESNQLRVHEYINPQQKFNEENNNIEECTVPLEVRFVAEINNNLPASEENVKGHLVDECSKPEEELNEFVGHPETEKIEINAPNGEVDKFEIPITQQVEKIVDGGIKNSPQLEEVIESSQQSKEDVQVTEKCEINQQLDENVDKIEVNVQETVSDIQPTQEYDEQCVTNISHPKELNNKNEPIQQFEETEWSNQHFVDNDSNAQTNQHNVENEGEMQHYNENEEIQNYNVNGQSTEQYNQSGQLSQHYDENLQSSQQYDENEQPIQQYDENGQLIQQYDENGQYLPHYDEHGQPLQQYNENGQIIDYNEQNQFVQQYHENGVPIQYDQNQQQIQQYDENGQPIHGYDENGQPIEQYDENQQALYQYGGDYEQTQQYYDENGQILQQYDESGQPILYTDNQQAYDNQEYANYEAELSQTSENANEQSSIITDQPPESEIGNQIDEVKPKEMELNEKPSKVLEMLDTDTESIKQDTKVTNDSDFDFSNG